jgi:uncharacterized repeat protein (TIGR01451 family)
VSISDTIIANNGNDSSDRGLYAYSYFYSGVSVVTVTNSCIINNSGDGIYSNGSVASFSMTGSDISGNGGDGFDNTTSVTSTATSNWWGHPSGPTHVGNLLGSGQAVSNFVDYSDWAETPICQSYLRLAKQGPDTVIAGEPMTYTLTVFNRSPVTATNVVITDAVPAGISQVKPLDRGSVISGPVVRWIVAEVPPQGNTTVRFIMTPTVPSVLPLVNSDYRATADDGSTTRGIYPLDTTVVRGGSAEFVDGQVLSATNSKAVALRDLDGDGDLDAVVVNGSPNQVWLNNGDGTFNAGQGFGNDASQAVALGDLNGDDHPDILVGNNGVNAVWLNTGNGTFNPVSDLDFGSEDSQAIALGDLNGDGLVDAFVGNNGSNEIWLNDGSSGFDVDPNQTPGSGNSQAVALADFDTDGDLDAVVGNGLNEPNQVWLNTGFGVFTTTITGTLGLSNVQAIAVGDVDQDGTIDVVLGTGDGPDQVWFGVGDGTFNPGPDFGSGNSQVIALGDFDADGDLDAFVGTGDKQANRVYLNDGSGTFTDTGQPFAFTDSTGVAVGDLDGDGDLDVIVVNDGQADRVYLNRNREVAEIGTGGGSVTSVSEGLTVTVTIPPGLLNQSTIFTFTEISGPTPPVSPTLRFGRRAFILVATQNGQPVSGALSQALTITVHYSPTAMAHPDAPRLYYRDEVQQVWLDVANTCTPLSPYVRATGVLTVGLCHLTEFGLFEPNTPPIFNVSGSPLLTPTHGVTLTIARPAFAWAAATDDAGSITYTLTITGSGAFTGVGALAAVDVVTVTETTYTPAISLPAAAYSWTVRAWDEVGLPSAVITPATFQIAAGDDDSSADIYLPALLKE